MAGFKIFDDLCGIVHGGLNVIYSDLNRLFMGANLSIDFGGV